MNKQEVLSILKGHPLFASLTDEEAEIIFSASKIVSIPKDDYLVREGDLSDKVCLILRGKVTVIKEDKASKEKFPIAVLESGETVGEISFIDQCPRSASVQAAEEVQCFVISLEKFKAFSKEIKGKIVQNISLDLSKKLRSIGEFTVESLETELKGSKLRVEMGRLLINVLILLSSWIFSIGIVRHYSNVLKTPALISTPLILAIFFLCFNHVRNSMYPISYFGVTLKNWKKYALEGVVFSLPFLILAFLIKWYLVTYIPQFQGMEIANWYAVDYTAPIPPKFQFLIGLTYIFLSPMQEFLARGMLQSSLQAVLSGRYAPLWAIILSNLVFASFHVQLSPILSLFALIFGLFWGWIYHRQGSLVGCSISHILIGVWSLGILNFGALLRNV